MTALDLIFLVADYYYYSVSSDAYSIGSIVVPVLITSL